ncbi:MAG: STN domain-containing protein, partial [Bacteroidales bacterium]|nr:STN domain-containing protein [Bacteroidales bacterium]
MKNYALSVYLFLQKTSNRRFFNIMRISVILLFVSFFASYASNVRSQTAKVNIVKPTQTVGSFIRQVEKETGYLFVYNKQDVDVRRSVSLEKGRIPVSDCLEKIFDGSGLSYVFEDDYIVLTKYGKEPVSVNQQS